MYFVSIQDLAFLALANSKLSCTTHQNQCGLCGKIWSTTFGKVGQRKHFESKHEDYFYWVQ